MKSQVNGLLHVLLGVFKDIEAAYPALKGSLRKDIRRVALNCQSRGLAYFTLDLPSLESCLLAGLESGRLEAEGPCSHMVSQNTRVPRFLSGLWLRVFDKSACLRQDADATALFFLRQVLKLGKKLEVGCSPWRLAAALENYHGIERTLRRPTFKWEADDRFNSRDCLDLSLTESDKSADECAEGDLFKEEKDSVKYPRWLVGRDYLLLQRAQIVCDFVVSQFRHFSAPELSYSLEQDGLGTGLKHGPGAVAERVTMAEKSKFPNWPYKLEYVFPYSLCGSHSGNRDDIPLRNEVPSRLICVPKTSKGPRIIAAEPTSHQWCQQLLLRFFNIEFQRLFGGDFLDLKSQSKSGQLVLQASIDRKLATVDLTDASDRLSCWTVERCFRSNPNLLNALHAARTRLLRDDVSKDPSFLLLRKFASQGTACTFPVQSLVFLCLALSVSLKTDKVSWSTIGKLRTQVRVYGDDIIIPRRGYEDLVRLLQLLELKANTAKSYANGHFRESCGTDGFKGYDVTPCCPKTLDPDGPTSREAVVDTINNLFVKGLWNASSHLESLLPPRLRRGLRQVGLREAGIRGLLSFSGSNERHLVSRWNQSLHRREVRVWGSSLRFVDKHRTESYCLLDFFAREHNPWNPRIVSNDRRLGKARDGLHWEPSCTGTVMDARYAFSARDGSRISEDRMALLEFATRIVPDRSPTLWELRSGHQSWCPNLAAERISHMP